MDLPVIGTHCTLSSCRTLDLLPITCPSCALVFCQHHAALSAHSCLGLEQNHHSLEAVKDVPSKRARCAFQGCQNFTLESVAGDTDQRHPEERLVASCPHCTQSYCVIHRHAPDHNCIPAASSSAAAVKNPAAHALLHKHFPASSVSQMKKPALRHPKKSAAVELMKMRHHALPADPKDRNATVPLSERLHLKILLPDTAPQTFWLRKSMVTGRALDLLADRFAVHISDSMPVYLHKLSTEDGTPMLLRHDIPLAKQLEDGETVQLSRSPS